MTPITLTKAAVIAAGRAAYLEGRLSAQGPVPNCSYRDRAKRPCIIGASLSDAVAKRWDSDPEDSCVEHFATLGVLKTDDLKFLSDLQNAHDTWASSTTYRSVRSGAEARLCKLLGLPAPVKP